MISLSLSCLDVCWCKYKVITVLEIYQKAIIMPRSLLNSYNVNWLKRYGGCYTGLYIKPLETILLLPIALGIEHNCLNNKCYGLKSISKTSV